MVQATQEGAGRGLCPRFPWPRGIFRRSVDGDLARCAALERESMAIIAELCPAWINNHDQENRTSKGYP
jgi:hypothetical protein